MKKTKLLAAAMGLLSVFMLGSCLGNDDDDSLTPEEQKSAYLQVKGDYEGSLIYSKLKADSSAYVRDTIPAQWSIDTDSTLLVKSFPSELLAANITDANIKKAMAASAPVDLHCYTGYYSLSPVAFLVNPLTATYNLSYSNASHKVQVAFLVNSTYSFGTLSSQVMQIQLVEAGVYVDGTYQSSLLKVSVPFLLKGKNALAG